MGLFDAFKPKSDLQIAIENAKRIQKENSTDSLYQFEHVAMPQILYSQNANLFEVILRDQERNGIYDLYAAVCKKRNDRVRFGPECFITSFLYRDDGLVMKTTMPDPYRVGLCTAIYQMVNYDGVAISYFCIELAQKISENDPSTFLCSWTREHIHKNHKGLKENYKNTEEMETVEITFLGTPIDTTDVHSFDELVSKAKSMLSNETIFNDLIRPSGV